MDMWCPYGIGREIWDREVLRIVCYPLPLERGDLPNWCVSLRGCRRVGPHRVIVVVVVVVVVLVLVLVVVEYIIILIIIIVVVIDSAQLQFCQTVNLESSLFFKPLIFLRKVMGRSFQTLCASIVFLWPEG